MSRQAFREKAADIGFVKVREVIELVSGHGNADGRAVPLGSFGNDNGGKEEVKRQKRIE